MRRLLLASGLILALLPFSACGRRCVVATSLCAYYCHAEDYVVLVQHTQAPPRLGWYRVGFDGKVVVPANRDRSCNGILVLQTRYDPLFLPPGVTAVSPTVVDPEQPPASLGFQIESVDTTYGTPEVVFYDDGGAQLDQETSVAATDHWFQVAAPDLTQSETDTLTVVINEREWNGERVPIASAQIEVVRDVPVDADGDGYAASVDCNDNDPAVNPGASPDCSGHYPDRNCNGIPDVSETCAQCCDNRGCHYCY